MSSVVSRPRVLLRLSEATMHRYIPNMFDRVFRRNREQFSRGGSRMIMFDSWHVLRTVVCFMPRRNWSPCLPCFRRVGLNRTPRRLRESTHSLKLLLLCSLYTVHTLAAKEIRIIVIFRVDRTPKEMPLSRCNSFPANAIENIKLFQITLDMSMGLGASECLLTFPRLI